MEEKRNSNNVFAVLISASTDCFHIPQTTLLLLLLLPFYGLLLRTQQVYKRKKKAKKKVQNSDDKNQHCQQQQKVKKKIYSFILWKISLKIAVYLEREYQQEKKNSSCFCL